MIAYVESSGLAMMALRQAGHLELQTRLLAFDEQVCQAVGIIELSSAAARWIRRTQPTPQYAQSVRESIEEIWRTTTKHAIDDAQIQRAAGLCERYQLRAYDALHLAAAESLMRIVSSKHMRWFGFDEMQNKAAVAIGLRDGMVD